MDDTAAGPGELAVRLRRWRLAAALSQEELAARAGLTAKAIGALERGERRRPYPHTVRALADSLGLDEDDRAALAAAAAGSTVDTLRLAQAPDPQPLPVPPAPLVGRQQEHDRAVAELRSGRVRLLTLTGPGGVGKTRLALEVARTMAGAFPRAVTVVELAPVPEWPLVLPTVARVMGGQHRAGPAVDSLAAALGARRHLLVLDNLEHVLDVAGNLADLLTRCPGLHVLATSRAALRVRAEHAVPLDPLPVPTDDDVAAVAASPAVQVFLDRAAAAGGTVVLDPGTAADVAAICRRLDGLPLALELAAAHARFLTPSALLGHLDQAVGSSRSRDLPARQRTVRATLDWSHGLLTHDEQVLLRRLSVLPGSFSLPAAVAVGGDDIDVLTSLSGLVEQSLLAPEPGPESRYRALEPVRQYAAARLAESGEDALAADRAAGFFAELAAGAQAGLLGPEQAVWLDRLAAEHGHLGATLARLADTGRLGEAARLGAATWLYWALRSNASEGLARLERVAAAAQTDGPALDDAGRAGLHVALAGLRYASGDLAGMGPDAAEAVQAARLAGLDDVLVGALVLEGSAAVFTGDLARARGTVAEALERAGTASAWGAAHAVIADAQLRMSTGDVAGAAARLDEAERAARELGSPFTLATVLNMQGTVAQAGGDDSAALDRLVEAADLAAEVGTTWTLVYTLPQLAVLAARRGQPALAAQLFAAGSATAEAASLAVAFPPDLESAQRWLQAVQAELGAEAFAQAWDAGRRVRPADVPGLARSITASP
ncbi:MAG TPA: helix-turn-helix domain-containing protein [Jiangellales bacterium]|nr:helix-turn-helix domain-containing protein [Jiangellales bacterium]